MALHHTGNIQVFETDCPMATHQPVAELMEKIRALIRYFLVKYCNTAPRLSSIGASLLGSTKCLLEAPEFFLSRSQVGGMHHLFTSGERSEVMQSQVYTNRRQVIREFAIPQNSLG